MSLRSLGVITLLSAAVVFGGCASEKPPESDDDGGMDAGVDIYDGTGADSADDTSPDTRTADVALDGGDADGMEEDGGSQGPATKQCGTLPSPPPGELCQVTSGSSKWLLLQGDVLTDSTVYENGEVLVERTGKNGIIRCTGCDCGSKAGGATPTKVACADGVISPSLINPHDHLNWATAGPYDNGKTRYQHRHEWRTGARMSKQIPYPSGDSSRESILHGELRHLFGGATSIAGSTSGTEAQGLLRNLDNVDATGGIDVSVEYSTFPLPDIGGELRENGCDYNGKSSNAIDAYSVLRNDIYLPHIAEGIGKAARNEYTCLSQGGKESRDLVEDNTSVIHGIGLTAPNVRELAANGAQLVWSPRTNISLYGQTADIPTYRKFDVPIALGTDWPISGSMNMLRELACADYLNRNHYDGRLSNHDLWKMATVNGAIALGVGEEVGRLQKGYVADIAIFDASDTPDFGAVVRADSSDVRLVLKGGEPLYGDKSVVDKLHEASALMGCSEVNVCGNKRRICVEHDTKNDADGSVDFGTLKAAATSDSYPLFHCEGSKQFEPTCVPARQGDYDGMSSMNDPDGDGIDNGADNCPKIFNPKRPLEGGQPDADGDGTGDVCDPCPTTKSASCPGEDFDRDGVPDDMDNCPFDKNRAQADGDNDGQGDACDSSTTPYDIHNGAHSPGERVELDGVVVTAVNDDKRDAGFFVQVPPDDPGWTGAEGSGTYVYLGQPPVPSRGDLVDVQGRLEDFHGRLQISGVTKLNVVSSNHKLPQPKVVAPCDIVTMGSKAESLRDALVRVEMVEVTDANPDKPQGDYGEFSVGNCMSGNGLRVDDLLHEIKPDPAKGDDFKALIGPLHYSFNNTKLVPRDANDVLFGPASLEAVEPATSYLKAGTMGVPKPGFELVLDRPSSMPTTVNFNYPDASMLTGPSQVTIASGKTRKSVPLKAMAASTTPTDFATVEASISGGMTQSAKVLVYDDSLQRKVESVSTKVSLVRINKNFQATVRLDMPAPSGGATVSLSTMSDLVLPGMSPTVAADTFETTFSVGAGSSEAKKKLTASLGMSSASASVTVKKGPVGDCLIISEYIEGSGRHNKAIELYNCGGTTLDLSNYGICTAFNSSTTCTQSRKITTTSVMLQPQQVFGVCNSKTGSSGDPVAGIKNNCDETASSVINFNGNDRLMLFEDKMSNGNFDMAQDPVVDMFGQLSMPPSQSPWSDETLRRCNLKPYLGMKAFNKKDYFTTHPKNDASDYGSGPSQASCP